MDITDAIVLGTRLHRLGQLAEAQAVYERVLSADPMQPDALQFLGLLRYSRGARDEGMSLVRRSISLKPESPGAHVNLGNMLLDGGQVAEAASAYGQAAALAEPGAELMNNLGVLRRHQGLHEDAEAAYRRAILIDPEFIDAYNNLGHLLSARGDHEAALKVYCQALAIQPANPASRRIAGLAMSVLGRLEQAAEIYRQWAVDEPGNPLPHHYLAACTGQDVPRRASDAYVEATFNTFADSFDAKLEMLTYRAPQLVADAVHRALGQPAGSLDVLDAGCGTGLCGALLAPYARRLIGVDLAGQMLAKARQRGQYHSLVRAELTAYLSAHPGTFDLIVCADTLCYFGDLTAVLQASAAALRPGGLLVFSVEADIDIGKPADHRIHPHGRYSHSSGYLERTVLLAGLGELHIEHAALRHEAGRPVRGYIVRARAAVPAQGAH